ncbi:MAG: C39 family peptidase [Mycobacteriaceae bacterium]|nr:C39 family peptidase [Mycobacteriaceae bacterium]
MTTTFTSKLAAPARKVSAGLLLGAALAATVVAHAGAAHATPAAGSPDLRISAAVFGDPSAAAPFWRYQTDSDCGEMSVADVVGQITGQEPSERDVTAVAEKTPSTVHSGMMWHSGAYTSNGDLRTLLSTYGIDSEDGSRSFEDLEQALGNGQKVIVGLNDNIVWNTSGDRKSENHFVVVTGIDLESGKVHLNDSGIASGKDEQVSVADFKKSWATSHDFAVITAK